MLKKNYHELEQNQLKSMLSAQENFRSNETNDFVSWKNVEVRISWSSGWHHQAFSAIEWQQFNLNFSYTNLYPQQQYASRKHILHFLQEVSNLKLGYF